DAAKKDAEAEGAIFHDEPFMADAVQEHHHCAKRRRCRGKQEDNQERVLLPGHFAVVVAALDSSRLSRELEVTLYTVDRGMRGDKPATLFSWTESVHFLRRLEAVSGREDGGIIYSSKPLACSARERGEFADGVYARFPLLCTPSRTLQLPVEAEVHVVDDTFNSKGENVTDGQASIGYALAEFRCLLAETGTGMRVLGKGLLVVDEDEDHKWQLLLPKSTAKLRWHTGVDGAEEHLGLDIVQAHGQRGQLCAAALGPAAACCLQAAGKDRAHADGLLQKFLTEGKKAFVEQNARTAWGLSRDRARPPTVQKVVRDPQELGGAAAAGRQVDLLAADRTSQHRVDVKYVKVL
ncbi:unnamed protein product, partial [Cladocopium goreaui]